MGTTINLSASDGTNVSAYKAKPAGTPRGAVVVIQEIFGVNAHIRSVADCYAQEGYVAIAPALFDRTEAGVELDYDADGVEKGKTLAFAMSMDTVMLDVEAAVDAAAMGPNGAQKVGIVGYCWGGSICYVAAARLPKKIAAASGYYGGQIMPHLESRPEAPLILHFGEEDHGIPLTDVDAIAGAHPHVAVHVYDGAGHGFNCDARGGFDEDAAATALGRTLAHFAEYVG
jgi:carboxymethylenebutenolidase